MENAVVLEAEANAGALAQELVFENAPRRGTVLEEYLRSRATRTRPHIVEAGLASAPGLELIPSPMGIRVRELCVRFGSIVVFASAIAGIIWLWLPF